MNGGLPERIDPREAAKAGLKWSGAVPLRALGRLAPDLVAPDGDVAVTLVAHEDEAGRAVLGGTAKARVQVLCQRCLEPMSVNLDVEMALVAVADDARARQLPDPYEPLELVPGGSVAVAELVEDELLLVLPRYPRHVPAQCAAVGAGAMNRRPGPFSKLATLKPGAARPGTKENS